MNERNRHNRPSNSGLGGNHARPAGQQSAQSRGQTKTVPTKRRTERSIAMDQEVMSVPIDRGEMTFTRRHLMYAAGGAVAIIALGGGAYAFNQVFGEKKVVENALDVSSGSVVSSNSIQQADVSSCVSLDGDFKLGFGTLLWCNDDNVAACLVPGTTGNPLTHVDLLWLSNGTTTTILEKAVDGDSGSQILDVRATSSGVVWVESNLLKQSWKVYSATISGSGTMGSPSLLDEGDSDWNLPAIALVGNVAFWQVQPNSNGNSAVSKSLIKRALVGTGTSGVTTVWESTGHYATALSATDNGVVIAPRDNSQSSVRYKLVLIDASSSETIDSLVLPSTMKPTEIGYCDTGFAFSFDAIYSSDSGVGNIGTYTPATKATHGTYDSATWFRWARTPACPPANCGNFLIVKSTSAVCGVNLSTMTYFAIDTDTGCEDYGDMLATVGNHKRFVIFSNVTSKPLQGASEQYCHVRVWTTV